MRVIQQISVSYLLNMLYIRNNRGNVALASILVVTSVIILVAITLNTYNQIQMELKHCYLNKIRAKMIAYQGLENAIAQLVEMDFDGLMNRNTNDLKRGGWAYYGEDSNKDGILNRGEDINDNKTLDTETCLINMALRPSFALVDNERNPVFIQVSNGARLGYSGALNNTYPQGSDIYSLKITDCHSQININGTGAGAKQLLNNLGAILKINEFPALGDYIFEIRKKKPSGRFEVKEELKHILDAAVMIK